jgi:hypothetical protein
MHCFYSRLLNATVETKVVLSWLVRAHGGAGKEMKSIVQRVLGFLGPLLAFHYRRAAKQDEDNGFPFTAAMEWRHAAELSSWVTPLANSSWREWERIIQLSRRLAEPIGVAHPWLYSDRFWPCGGSRS